VRRPRLPLPIRILFCLFPTRFRTRFEDELRTSIDALRLDASDDGSRPGTAFWIRTTTDLLGSLLLLRLEEMRRAPEWMATVAHRAIRRLIRRPGYLVTAVLTIGLGVGAATAMVAVTQKVLLAPLPYEEDAEITVVFNDGRSARPDSTPYFPISLDQYREFSASSSTTRATTWVSSRTEGPFIRNGVPEEVPVRQVARNFFEFLGVDAARGRVFTSANTGAVGPPVVLAHGAWRSRFGGDPDVLGRSVRLLGTSHTVIGVLPEDFSWHLPVEAASVEFWIPEVDPAAARFYDRWLLARPAAGRGAEDVRREFAPNAWEHFANDGRKETLTPIQAVTVETLREHVLGNAAARVPVLLSAVGLVLTLATLSVALLALGRVAGSTSELGVRRALGASRGHLMSLVLTETAAGTVLGGGTGLLLGSWGLQFFSDPATTEIPRMSEVGVDPWSVLVVAGICVGLFVVVSVVPLWFAVRVDTARPGARTDSGAGRAGDSTRKLLVGGQVALAVFLLLGSALLVKSWHAMATEDLGYRTDGVLVGAFDLPADAWSVSRVTSEDREDPRTLRELRPGVRTDLTRLSESLETLPGVQAVALARSAPLTDQYGGWSPVTLEGWEDRSWEEKPHGTAANRVEPEYFEVLGMEPTRGRLLTPEDSREGARPVAVVSESFAALFWPGEDPVGKRFYDPFLLRTEDGSVQWNAQLTGIVGVVPGQRERGIDEPEATAFFPLRPYLRHATSPRSPLSFLVRSSVPPETLADEARQHTALVFPTQPLSRLESLQEAVALETRETAFFGVVLSSFASYGLLLTLVGVVGVIAYEVNRRTHEIGVRVTLGANHSDVLGLLAREVTASVVLGLAIGVSLALATSGLLEAWLYEVQPLDPQVFALVPTAFLAVSLAAALGAARKALRLDPSRALRAD